MSAMEAMSVRGVAEAMGNAAPTGQHQALARVLGLAHQMLEMEFAYVAALDGERQVHLAVAGDAESFGAPSVAAASTTICRLMVDGKAPEAIPDTSAIPAVRELPIVAAASIGSYVGVPIRFSDGRLFGTLCGLSHHRDDSLHQRDISFIKMLADVIAQLFESEEARVRAVDVQQQKLARVAHDLRSPLTAILGYAELLREHTTRQPYAETIASEARRLNAMVDDLLADRSDAAAERLPFDLTAAVRQQVEVYRGHSQTHEIVFDAEPVWTLGDVGKTTNIVSNLLSNAIKYSPGGGQIVVSVDRSDDDAGVLSVRDHGLGIPAYAQDALFTPFFRVASTASDGISGTGLGLALVREAARQQGGDVGFTSEEGKGSEFWLCLPAAPLGVFGASDRP